MRKLPALMISLFFMAGVAKAQTSGEFKPDVSVKNSTGQKAKHSRDIYISSFSINYQIYNRKSAAKRGEILSRSVTGGTKAGLAIGLDGIGAEELQSLTNELYEDFLSDLRTQGFNIISDETAGQTRFYEKYGTYQNIDMTMAEAPGVARFYPQGRNFYFPKMDAAGKKKQGGVLGALNTKTTDKGRQNELFRLGKLSRELDDATIVDVNLYILFLSNAKAGLIGGAKVGVQTHLHLADNEFIEYGESAGKNTALAQTKASFKTFQAVSSVDAVKGGNRLNGFPIRQYTGGLKKDLEINGVINDEKITTSTKEATDSWGTETAFGRLYSAEGRAKNQIVLVKPDVSAYKAGVKEAVNKFLSHNAEEMAKRLQ